MSGVDVQPHTFDEFINNQIPRGYKLAIDSYQRPYVWNSERILELIEDLRNYLQDSRGLQYYMGSILLHKNNNDKRLYIIDGQQRLTTLCILYFVVNNQLPNSEKLQLEYNSAKSIENIRNCREIFSRYKSLFENSELNIFQNLCITFIKTQSEDLAFSFFDTQNNRGVKLFASDLLKAYHLRAIKINNLEQQIKSAITWEMIQKSKTGLNKKGDFAALLIESYLWRARSWRGQNKETLQYESFDKILNTFQKLTKTSKYDGRLELYPSRLNMLGKTLVVNSGKLIIEDKNHPRNWKNQNLPFEIRQPLFKGLHFFLYAEKYTSMVKHIFDYNESDLSKEKSELIKFKIYYHKVVSSLSNYFQELHIIANLLFYDKFGNARLYDFLIRLDHLLGAIRLNQTYIVRQTPVIFLRENALNLLDLIQQAYEPEDVIRYLVDLSNQDFFQSVYTKIEMPLDNSVKGVYHKAVLEYTNINSLKDKQNWLENESI